ncbi:unnamed protein product [Bursaphelenchus xylophilus]|uniref:(pine wood nematode) hypothetical protein n=1 Tax=Bursaphelenchus xylophilus TaxID=6326 RepID=A0A1I7RRC6_BURXY|nr:unnamed protein product [Bursaphelenchus xylophilus]CAG9130942.1 unnamed protein product [Bursaphelenchus xylophilus]
MTYSTHSSSFCICNGNQVLLTTFVHLVIHAVVLTLIAMSSNTFSFYSVPFIIGIVTWSVVLLYGQYPYKVFSFLFLVSNLLLTFILLGYTTITLAIAIMSEPIKDIISSAITLETESPEDRSRRNSPGKTADRYDGRSEESRLRALGPTHALIGPQGMPYSLRPSFVVSMFGGMHRERECTAGRAAESRFPKKREAIRGRHPGTLASFRTLFRLRGNSALILS